MRKKCNTPQEDCNCTMESTFQQCRTCKDWFCPYHINYWLKNSLEYAVDVVDEEFFCTFCWRKFVHGIIKKL